MSDPRLDVAYDDIKPVFATYKIDNSTITYSATATRGSASVDLAVNFSAAATAQTVGDGELVEGKLIEVFPDNFCTVQVGGYMTLPGGSGATLTLGEKIVGDLGAASAEGYIRAVATGTAAELGHARGTIVDASDTTAVVVRL